MIFCFPEIEGVIDTAIPLVNTIVIENQKLFSSMISDINGAINGWKGKTVLSANELILDMSKSAELVSTFIPFDMNRKPLLTKILTAVEKKSADAEHYMQTMKLMGDMEHYLDDLVAGFDCNLSFSKITPSSLIRAAGLEIVDDYESLAEKLIDYMELVREFDRDKLFVTVNMRSYIDDEETDLFMQTVIGHEYHVIMIENHEYRRLPYEKRRIVDQDLCVF